MLAMRAQQLPDGAALLKQSADALKNYNTYQYTDVATTTGAAAMEMTTVHQGTRSGKMRMEMRMEMKLGSMDGALIVSDGQYTWMYMAMLKRYMKVPAEPEALDVYKRQGHVRRGAGIAGWCADHRGAGEATQCAQGGARARGDCGRFAIDLCGLAADARDTRRSTPMRTFTLSPCIRKYRRPHSA